MIDIESELFTLIAVPLRNAHEGIYVANEYVSRPPSFPAVFFAEIDNTALQSTQDSGSLENHATVAYQADVYSNLNRGKKAQAKAIIGEIDALMSENGFTRTFLDSVQNLNDPTIYRMTARYRAVVSKDHTIYGR